MVCENDFHFVLKINNQNDDVSANVASFGLHIAKRFVVRFVIE